MLLKRHGGKQDRNIPLQEEYQQNGKIGDCNFNPASKWYKDSLLQKFIWLCFFHNMLQKYLKQLRT